MIWTADIDKQLQLKLPVSLKCGGRRCVETTILHLMFTVNKKGKLETSGVSYEQTEALNKEGWYSVKNIPDDSFVVCPKCAETTYKNLLYT